MNMNYTKEVEEMCSVKVGASHGCAPIPQEGKWTYSREIKTSMGLHMVLDGVHLNKAHVN